MRFLVAAITGTVVIAVLILARSNPPTEKSTLKRYWVKILFGNDKKKADWDGQLEIDDGRVHTMVGFCLETWDKLNPKTKSWRMLTAVKNTGRGVSYAEPTRGFLAEIETTDKTVVRIRTKQGNFEFKPGDLSPGRPTKALDGRATVEALGTASLVADSNTDDDFASIAIDDKGHRHVLWIAYDDARKRNDLLVRDVDDPKSRPRRINKAKEFASPHLFFVTGEGLRAVWCSPGVLGAWNIYTAAPGTIGWHTKQFR